MPAPQTTLYRDYLIMLTSFEGRWPHMYLDTTANVTIGVGHLLATAQDCFPLPFIGGDPVVDWWSVKGATAGMLARNYDRFTTARLTDAGIDAVLDSDLDEKSRSLLAAYPNYPQYPEPVRIGLLDIAFNLGIHGLGKYPHMFAALNAADWKTAAKESFRHGIRWARNEYVAGLITSAAG